MCFLLAAALVSQHPLYSPVTPMLEALVCLVLTSLMGAYQVAQWQRILLQCRRHREMATHSSILAREIPWTEKPRPWDCKSQTQLSPILRLYEVLIWFFNLFSSIPVVEMERQGPTWWTWNRILFIYSYPQNRISCLRRQLGGWTQKLIHPTISTPSEGTYKGIIVHLLKVHSSVVPDMKSKYLFI